MLLKRLTNFALSFFLWNFLFPMISQAQQAEEQMEAIIDSHHASFSEVGLIAAVYGPGEKEYVSAKGYTNLSFDVTTRVDHKFRIGSITKQFTAVAILKLVEDRKLSLTDSIQQFLPDFPYQGHKITVEHLLTHTSGITDYTSKADWFPVVSKSRKTPLELVAYFQEDSSRFVPGERYEYNNSGYHLLGCIIETVTKKPFEEYLDSLVFQPLQMKNTFCHNSTKVYPNLAVGYERMQGDAFAADFVNPAQPFSAGNMVSTVADLQLWYDGLFAGEIIQMKTLDKALKPFQLSNSSFTHYGYGWQLDTIQGEAAIKHGGVYPGYIAETLYFPGKKVLAVALSNAMPVSNMVKKLGAIALGKPLAEPTFVELDQKTLQLSGAVYGSTEEQWSFTVDDNRLFYSVNGGSSYEVKALNEHKFYSLDWDVYFEFQDKKDGKYQHFLLHWNGERYKYNLIDASLP